METRLNKRGFSLIEIAVVVGIIAVISIASYFFLFSRKNTVALNNTTGQVSALLAEAQSRATEQASDTTWGVHFDNTTSSTPFYALFSGSSYTSGTVISRNTLPTGVCYASSSIAQGSSTDVVFKSISGDAVASASITFDLTGGSCNGAVTTSTVLAINALGSVAIGSANACVPTPSAIWVVDGGNDRLEEFTASGSYLSQFGSYGSGNGQFGGPAGIAIDQSGNIWVADSSNNRVEEFNASGTYLSQFGSAGSGNGQFSNPTGIAIDQSGNIWIVDELNSRVEEFNASGTYLSQFGSAGSGNGQFDYPDDLAFDQSGNIWVVDSGNSRVQEFNTSGTYLSQFGSSGSGNGQFSGGPTGIAFDQNGNMWVVDSLGFGNNRVQEFTASGTYLSQFGSGGSGNGQFESPDGMAFDQSGNSWVVDFGDTRVEEFTASGTYLSQFGSYGSGNGQFGGPSFIAITKASCH